MRFWEKYAKWNGWKSNATPLQKTAYRLSKMSNRFSIQGEVVETTCMWMLKQKQEGIDRSADEAYEKMAKGLLRKHWDESKNELWKVNFKKSCLHEHYYPQFHEQSERDLIFSLADTVKLCLQNFETLFLSRFAKIDPDDEVPVTVVGQGDPEHFHFEGTKIYAIPDYVHREGDIWHIHDWKSGKIREDHHKQLGVYALWANLKHQIPVENIQIHIEYLQFGETISATVSEEDLEATRNEIRSAVLDMSEYLVDADKAKNKPLPQDEWEMTLERYSCARCKFHELCEPEFE